MDVKELPSGPVVQAINMPGVSLSDVKVQVEEGNVLAISGKHERPSEDGGPIGQRIANRPIGPIWSTVPYELVRSGDLSVSRMSILHARLMLVCVPLSFGVTTMSLVVVGDGDSRSFLSCSDSQDRNKLMLGGFGDPAFSTAVQQQMDLPNELE
ncbi:22.0 kDa class IV heat shock protein-like [Miscanthus floridulus]|uniref:22.0 kDa class IV heat shock protein-like n=1 Tax=Miscanthus floridulus TaxID=154761 RepID=UPI00345AA5D6